MMLIEKSIVGKYYKGQLYLIVAVFKPLVAGGVFVLVKSSGISLRNFKVVSSRRGVNGGGFFNEEKSRSLFVMNQFVWRQPSQTLKVASRRETVKDALLI